MNIKWKLVEKKMLMRWKTVQKSLELIKQRIKGTYREKKAKEESLN